MEHEARSALVVAHLLFALFACVCVLCIKLASSLSFHRHRLYCHHSLSSR